MPLLPDPAFGALCAAGSALTWAVISLLVRTLSPAFNSVTLNALRSTLGGALVVAWVGAAGGLPGLTAVSARTLWLLSISVVLAVGIGDTVFFESSRDLGLARAMTLSMSYPLIAALLAVVFLGETLTLQVALGSLVTLGGLALTVTAKREGVCGHGRFGPGIGAATLAAIAWAVSVVLLKPTLREVDAIAAQAIRLPLAGALLWATPWAWRSAGPLGNHGRGALWRLAALGVLTAVSSIMFVQGVRYSGVAVATVLSSTAPVFAIPLGVLFLGERLTPTAVAGTILALIGITVLQR